ncbi:hypothetical protein ACQI4L_05505 [Mycolicibacterium litorale]|uniref:hypothetical protein n=1 Tax=Mycolicibacterium litorale TaxID=758802 RepID=UPI003CEC88C7
MELFEETGRDPRVKAVAERVGFDEDTVQRALRALYREPFFEKVMDTWGGGLLAVGAPTSAALRVAGQWPSPEVQLERLVAALEAVAADDSRPEEERSRAKQAGLWLTGALRQIAMSARSDVRAAT